MKILLLGGTGAMGMHLAKLLADDNIETYVTTRKSRQDYDTVHYIQGNAHDENFLFPLLEENFDVVVDFMVYNTEEFKSRSKALLEKCGQYVFLSSSRVYANSTGPLTEESPRLLDVSQDKDFLVTDEYALTKARQENILFDSQEKNWTVIRPYITYSEIRLQLGVLEKEQWLRRALSGKTVLFSKEIMPHKTTLTYGKDVALGIKALLGKEAAMQEAFHITQPKALRWEEVWSVYKKVLSEFCGSEPAIKLAGLSDFYKFHRSGTYQIKYDRLFDREFDSSKIAKFVDLEKFVRPEAGLENCLRSFVKDVNRFECFSWSVEGIADRITRDKQRLGTIPGLKNKMRYVARKMGIDIHR